MPLRCGEGLIPRINPKFVLQMDYQASEKHQLEEPDCTEEFGWALEDRDRQVTYSRIRTYCYSLKVKNDGNLMPSCMPLRARNKALERSISLNDLESGYRIKSVEYRQMSTEMASSEYKKLSRVKLRATLSGARSRTKHSIGTNK